MQRARPALTARGLRVRTERGAARRGLQAGAAMRTTLPCACACACEGDGVPAGPRIAWAPANASASAQRTAVASPGAGRATVRAMRAERGGGSVTRGGSDMLEALDVDELRRDARLRERLDGRGDDLRRPADEELV